MTTLTDDGVHQLTEAACWALLGSESLGRLGVVVRDDLEIFPVNYRADAGRLLFRTAEGTKLAALTVHDRVVFEVDGVTETTAWSVVVKGTAHALERESEILDAEAVRPDSWLPIAKTRFVEILPRTITGRGFRRGPEPELDPSAF
jgi:nitroimidazol reductase NimA-like FMN-containing flavoprotein (pyridoxamine 5'-phosphate oxidase superfamily)